MSRHRIVRSMNYEDEYFDDEDEYSRSVEDNYCISPSTAAQFTWNREKNVNFSTFMNNEEVIDEGDEEAEEDYCSSPRKDSLSDSASSAKLQLSGLDQAKLNSCLEEIRNILGESESESVMVEAIIQNQFNLDQTVNQLLKRQDVPKPQREPRQHRNRSQDDKDADDLDILLQEIKADDLGKSSKDDVKGTETNRFRANNKHISHGNICEAEQLKNSIKNVQVDSKNSLNKPTLKHLTLNQKSHIPLEALAQKSKSAPGKANNPDQSGQAIKKMEIAGKSKNSGVSLSELIKQNQTPSRGEHISPSLSQLAEQNKRNTPSQKLSSGEKVAMNMSSLSALVAKHSEQKKTASSGIVGQSETQHKTAGSQNSANTTEQSKPSLTSLIQAHSANKDAKISLVQQGANDSKRLTLDQLAQSHKKTTVSQSNKDKSTMGNQKEKVATGNTSVSTLLQDLSLNKTRQGVKTLNLAQGLVPDEKRNVPSVSSLDLSLSSCLRDHKKAKGLKKDSLSSLPNDLKETLDLEILNPTKSWFECEIKLAKLQDLDASLVSSASTLGMVLCSAARKRKTEPNSESLAGVKKAKKFPKFSSVSQVGGRELYKDDVYKSVRAFDFSSMSPDDVVGQRQRQAFTRSDKEFTV